MFDGYAGADPEYRLPLRVVTERAWHSLFSYNMFLRETDRSRLEGFVPDAHVIDLPGLLAGSGDRRHPLLDLHPGQPRRAPGPHRRHRVRGRDQEEHLRPAQVPAAAARCAQHALQRQLRRRQATTCALFFGLSGTGKTTLSADPKRTLIGDDEHGWSDDGVFNFEGGCYAKVIKLRRETEPEIFATTERFGTVLENVVFDPVTRELDLDDAAKTENTRVLLSADAARQRRPRRRRRVIPRTSSSSPAMPSA